MVWLHGLGADGYDLEPVAQLLGLSGVRHIFPHAPVRPVTINGGMAMRAWYDIAAPNLSLREDGDGMLASARQVIELINRLQKDSGLPVVLSGFSQGAVIALVIAVLEAQKLRGVVAMSGYVPDILSSSLSALQGTAILMAHGKQDEVVPYQLGKTGAERMLGAGVNVAWHSYEMPHAICQQEILDMGVWLNGLLELNQAA